MSAGASRSATRARRELCLVYVEDGQTRVFPIPEGTTTLGSAVDNDVVLGHASVKPHHLVLMCDRETVELRDLFAGVTRVNDEERRSGALVAGDTLELGELRMRLLPVSARDTARLRRAAAPPPTEPPTESMARSRVATAVNQRPPPPPPEQPQPQPREPAPPPPPAPDETGEGTARYTSAPAARPAADEAELQRLRDREARRGRALARARQLSDEVAAEDDFELMLERIAIGFLEIFAADRAVCVLFEEDGRNPLLTVERCRIGTDEGAGVAQEIIDRCLQVRSVLRVSGGHEGLGGLAAPLLSEGRALGLLYFERVTTAGQPFEAEDVHLMAMLTNQASVVIAPLIR